MTGPASSGVSAIVVTFYSGPALKECLNALRSDPEVSEIVVVNNGTTTEDLDWVRSVSQTPGNDTRIVTGHGNVGFSAGVNLGVEHSRCDKLLVINPDAVLHADSITELELARQMGKSPCLVGGKLIYPDGSEVRGARREALTPWRVFVSFSGLSKLESRFKVFRSMHRDHDPEPESAVPMPVVSGACCYISRTDFDSINGFDEGYFLHVEDIDICRRVAEAGGEVMYAPKAVALHYGSTSKASVFFVEWNKAKGLARYFSVNAKSDLTRGVAKLSIVAFAPLLIGRSLLIRSVQKVRNALSPVDYKTEN